MENKTAEKAKKGALSIVFSRTALILLLVVVQFLLMLGIATYLRDYVVYVYSAMNILGAVIVIYIINQRGNPAFNMTWVLLILIFPVFGCLFYLYVKSQLGTRYIGKRLGRLKLDTWQYMEQKQEIIDDLRLSKPANANLAHYMKHQLGFPTYRNTKATYFACGEEKFTVLLERLEKAEKFIFLEYFIVEEGYMWDSILDILKRKVQEGVEVRFMYDGMCSISLLPYNYPKTIRKYGIQCK
ncbi:PLDc N-terminal domain-containing protein, partial [Faecalicatena contorta]